jgi:dienelactone hydrolase
MRLFVLFALLLAPLVARAEREEFTAAGNFSEATVQHGVRATREQCAKVDNAVWAATKEHGEECIKYWAAGLARSRDRAVVFFHGDIWVGRGKTSPIYLNNSSEKLQADADKWAFWIKAPYIFVGRPGVYGSSGDHMERRRPAETIILSAALDALKQKLGIKEWVVAGQSGGGHVTSSLLTYRNDIVCAVPTSAPSSPRVRYTLRGLKRDTTGFTDSYEPTEHLDKSIVNDKLRVFVLGNPRDTNVVWPSQTIMATKLKDAGIPVDTIEAKGTGPDGHGLNNSARTVAGWCFNDVPTVEIMKRAAKGLRG